MLKLTEQVEQLVAEIFVFLDYMEAKDSFNVSDVVKLKHYGEKCKLLYAPKPILETIDSVLFGYYQELTAADLARVLAS